MTLHPVVAAVTDRIQGPRANGMPELHRLNPALGSLGTRASRRSRHRRTHVRRFGRCCRRSMDPEAIVDGALARVHDGDLVRVSADAGTLDVILAMEEWHARDPASPPPAACGTGRELFAFLCAGADGAEQGGSAMLAVMEGELAA